MPICGLYGTGQEVQSRGFRNRKRVYVVGEGRGPRPFDSARLRFSVKTLGRLTCVTGWMEGSRECTRQL